MRVEPRKRRLKSETYAGNDIFGISQPLCGNRMINTRKRRITNGEKTLPGEHPWIVALAYRKTVGCGGTIMVS